MKRAAIVLGYTSALLGVAVFILGAVGIWFGDSRLGWLAALAGAAAFVLGIIAVVLAGMAAERKTSTTIIGRDS